LPQGFEPGAYVAAILARFRNPAIRHLLAQIAWDGSQKIPVRLLGTIADALSAGRCIDRLCLPVAGWLRFVVRQSQSGVALVDPMDAQLSAIGRGASGDATVDVFLRLDSVFGTLAEDARFVEALRDGYAALGDGQPATVARALTVAAGTP